NRKLLENFRSRFRACTRAEQEFNLKNDWTAGILPAIRVKHEDMQAGRLRSSRKESMSQPWEIESFLEVNNGKLHVNGVDAVELAREFGTPLFVYSENRIRHNI